MDNEFGIFCPVCEGECVYMGGLGLLIWFRCRYCGLEFSVNSSLVEELLLPTELSMEVE